MKLINEVEQSSNGTSSQTKNEPFSDDEYSPLLEVIVGRAEHSCFPAEPPHMVKAVAPPTYRDEFKPHTPFPKEIVDKAIVELDNLASTLERMGIKVYRPNVVDWVKVGGYTGSMARDGLIVVGNHVIESCYAFKSRRHEIELGSRILLDNFAKQGYKIIRAPAPPNPDTLYDGIAESNGANGSGTHWAINNSRPAFDAADFMRIGKDIFGQLSNVTNQKGLDYFAANLPEGYKLHLPKIDCPAAMHLDTTIVPIRPGFCFFDERYVEEAELRNYPPFNEKDAQGAYTWRLYACAKLVPKKRDWPPLYMTSPAICVNVLTIDEKIVLAGEDDHATAKVLEEEAGMEVIRLPFQHVNCLGGSFHCATVDVKRKKPTV